METNDELEPLRRVEMALEQTQAQAKELPTKGDLKRNESRLSRNSKVLILVFTLFTVLNFLFSGFLYGRQAETATATQINNASIQSVLEENSKREEQGLEPIPVPVVNMESEEINIDALISARVASLSEALRNDPTIRGAIGGQGPMGDQGIQGVPGMPCLPSIPECRGPQGLPGTDGEDGEDSIAVDGQDGTNGTNGVDGLPGEPGRGVLSFGIEGTDTECAIVTRYTDGQVDSTATDPVFCAVLVEPDPPIVENP